MTHLKLALFSALTFGSAVAVAAPTQIVGHRLLRTRLLSPADRNGFTYYMGVAEGKVTFTGPGPVFVTLKNGTGRYSAPVDREGTYSFFFEVNARDVVAEAWIPGETTSTLRSRAAVHRFGPEVETNRP